MSNLEHNKKPDSLVHLYVGNGKGKTTAAAGLAVRYLGQGGRVLFCQFLKSSDSGEVRSIEKLGGSVLRGKESRKFVFQMNEQERCELKSQHQALLAKANEFAQHPEPGLLVLDEVVDAVNCSAIDLETLLELINNRAPGVEIVLTGRKPCDEIVRIADYHTDFVCKKHPFDQGIQARRGVEF